MVLHRFALNLHLGIATVWLAVVGIAAAGCTTASAQSALEVVSWNVESDGAEPQVVAERIASFQGIDVWGLSEVKGDLDAGVFETASEMGEGADFQRILGATGGSDRLAIVYDAERFELVDSHELDHINVGGNVRAPLIAHLRDRSAGFELLFMVNHLYRSRDPERHQQARLLNEWAAAQTVPVIAVGDYNFDWEVVGGDQDHDEGYDLITEGGFLQWVRPDRLVRTQCSAQDDGSCRFDSVLDFVFVSEATANWQPAAEILVEEGDFPDDDRTSDHRPVRATFQVPGAMPPDDIKRQVLERIQRIERELSEIRRLLEQLEP